MSKRINWLITDHNITVNYEGQTHIVPRTDPLADTLIDAVKTNKLDEIPNLVSAAKRVENFGKGVFEVRDGSIFVDGVEVSTVLGTKILRFADEGLPVEPLIKFAKNLQKNPSFRAVNELYQFLEKNDHPITENGSFIAYKRVQHNFLDIHSGTFDNSPGKVVEMSRNQVDEDSARTCSAGLHVANWDYAHNHFSHAPNDVMLEVEVNPADVVAIPTDYNQSKMRVCRYKVLGVVDHEHSSDVQLRIVNSESTGVDNEADITFCKCCGELMECEEGCFLDCLEYCESCVDGNCEGCSDCVCSDCKPEDNDPYPWEDELT